MMRMTRPLLANEISRLVEAGRYNASDIAVFYRTNAQSRAVEEVFIRLALPYRVVGGVRFYERKEVRDIVSYLRALVNPHDDVAFRRIINTPARDWRHGSGWRRRTGKA